MNIYWDLARYVGTLLQERLRAARSSDSQAGALSLEWLVIAIGIALAAVFAVGIFYGIVKSDSSKLNVNTNPG